MAFVETATFECGGCGGRSPSTWIDYDRLGYPVCPDCGRVDRPFVVRSLGTGSTVRGTVDGAESTPEGTRHDGTGDRGRRSAKPSR